MNMNFELIKERNGWKPVEVPDLKVGDTIKLYGDKPNRQPMVVHDIYQTTADNIMVDCYPKYTPVRNPTTFKYGKTKFKVIPFE